MKKFLLTLGGGLLLAAAAFGETKQLTRALDFSGVALEKISASGAEYAYLAGGGLEPMTFTPGAPSLPGFTEIIKLPKGAEFQSATVACEWREFAADVLLFPVQEAVAGNEAPAAFTAPAKEFYTADEFAAAAVGEPVADATRDGVTVAVPVVPFRYNPARRILQASAKVTISLEYRQSFSVLSDVAAADRIDYVLIAPPKYYTNWCDYVEWRASTHPELNFLCKNAIEIYEDHPYAGYVSTNGTTYATADGVNVWRNAAESIHAYLRKMKTEHDLEYAVLAGAWFNCRSTSPGCFYGGETMSITNAIPGLFVNGGFGTQPSDYFYACLDIKAGVYPWDSNGNGVYGQISGDTIDIVPDIVVSRISFKPSTYVAAGYTIPGMIAAYTNKLAKVEAEDFSGNHRFGTNWGSLRGDQTISQTTYAGRDYEFEYFDGLKNIFDPRHGSSVSDKELATRLFFRNGLANNLPIASVIANNVASEEATNLEFIHACAHGLEIGTCGFLTSNAGTSSGLAKLYCAISPCLTGCPDWNENGYMQPSLGETFVQNPKGGTVCSFAGGRVGYYQPDGNMYTYGPDLYSKRIEYHFFENAAVGTNSIGQVWKTMETLMAQKGAMSNSQSRWCLYNQFFYGDPLVRFSTPEHFYATQPNRRMNGLRCADASATIAVNGGTGLEPFTFTGARGTVTFATPSSYYVGGLANVAEAVLAGTNTTLDLTLAADVDKITFAAGSHNNTIRTKTAGALADFLPLKLTDAGVILETNQGAGTEPSASPFAELDGGSLGFYPNPNYGLSAGAWECILQPITMKNGSTLNVDRSTTFALGSTAHPGTASFDITGTNSWTTTNSGAIKLCGTTVVTLNANSLLKLDANILDNGNGKLKFVGAGTVELVAASAAGGSLEIGEGVTVVFDSIPLSHVTNITLGANAKVVLPKSDVDFWNFAPLKGCTVTVDDSVEFYEEEELDEPIVGTLTRGGGFFRKGAVQEWNAASGVWSEDESYTPWVLDGVAAAYSPTLATYFGNLTGTAKATVRLDGAMASAMSVFANSETAYEFLAKDADAGASLTFNSLMTGGDFTAETPLSAITEIDVMGGAFKVSATNSPAVAASTVTIRDGASFAASSIYSTIPRIRGMRVLFNGCTATTVDVIEIYCKIGGVVYGRGRDFSSLGGTMFDSNGSNATNLGRLVDNAYACGVMGGSCSTPWTAPFVAGETHFGVMFATPVSMPTYFCMAAKPGNRPTSFQLQITQDGQTWTTIATRSPTFGSYNIGGWDGNSTDGSYNGIWMSIPHNKTAVAIEDGGMLCADGSYYADLTFADGGGLKAVAGAAGLVLESGATFNFPDDGSIKVDASALDFDAADHYVLVQQPGWQTTDLRNFTVIDKDAELRLIDGDACVVEVDEEIQPPYLLGVCGTAAWNSDAWYWYDDTAADEASAWNKFPNRWDTYNYKQNAEAWLDLCGDATLDVDVDVIIDTVCACKTNNQPTASLTITSSNNSKLTAQALDLSLFSGNVTLDIEGLSGEVTPPGGTLIFNRPATNAVLVNVSMNTISAAIPAGECTMPLIRVGEAGMSASLTMTLDGYSLTEIGDILYAVDLAAYREKLENGENPLGLDDPSPYHNWEFEGNLNQTNHVGALNLTASGSSTAAYVDSRAGQAMINALHYCGEAAFGLGGSTWTITTTARMITTANQVAFAVGRLSTVGLALTSKSRDSVCVAYWYNGGAHSDLIVADVPNATCQFHHYAIRVRDRLVELFVDGLSAGKGYMDEGHTLSGATGFQFHSVHGGLPGGLGSSGGAIALDNLSLYRSALSELDILKLSVGNPAWPESLVAELSAGDNGDWKALDWFYRSGASVGTIDWSNVALVTFAADADAAVALSFMPEASTYIAREGDGAVTFTVPAGDTLSAAARTSGAFVDGQRVEIAAGATLDLSYTNQARLEGADWSNLGGEGTVRLGYVSGTAADANWTTLPTKFFGSTLSLELQGVGIITDSTQLKFRNLSGAGKFRADFNDASTRSVRTEQTTATEWTGALIADTNAGRAITVYVASDGATPSAEKSLTYSGTTAITTARHKFNVETNGYLVMNGSFNGDYVVNGTLVLPTAADATNTLANAVSGEGLLLASGAGTLEIPAGSSVHLANASSATIILNGVEVTEAGGELIGVEDGFDPNAHEILIRNSSGEIVDNLALSVGADGMLRYGVATYHAIIATAAARWSELDWRNQSGKAVVIDDWSQIYSATVTGACADASLELDVALPAAGQVTFAGDAALSVTGEGTLPTALTLQNAVTITGGQLPTLETFTQAATDDVLTIGAGATVATTASSAGAWCLGGAKVVIEAGGRLELKHTANTNLQSLNWSGITGYGTIALTGGKSVGWIVPPAVKNFCSSLTFESDTIMSFGTWSGDPGTGITCRNLAGSGDFTASQPWNAEVFVHPLKTHQSTATTWSGILYAPDNTAVTTEGRSVWLEVYGTEATPTIERSLEIAGVETARHKLTIGTSGYVRLTGAWYGPIVNNGVLRYEPAADTVATTNNCSFSGSGRVSFGGEGTLRLHVGDGFTLAADSDGTLELRGVSFDSPTGDLMAVENGFTTEGKTIILSDADGNALDGYTLRVFNGWLGYRLNNYRGGKLLVR